MNKPVMENPRPEKVATVEEILAKLNSAPAVFVSEYRGMSVTALANLRGTLRDVGAEHKVYKNTLAKLAVRQAGLDALDDLLVGPTSLTFAGTDTVGASPGPIRCSCSRAGASGRPGSASTTSRRSPSCRRARSCWRCSPVRCRRRW